MLLWKKANTLRNEVISALQNEDMELLTLQGILDLYDNCLKKLDDAQTIVKAVLIPEDMLQEEQTKKAKFLKEIHEEKTSMNSIKQKLKKIDDLNRQKNNLQMKRR